MVERFKGKDTGFIVQHVEELPTERGTCGFVTTLITEKDCGSVGITHLKVSDAQKHYHEKTTEFYYVTKGTGELLVNHEVIYLKEGTIVMIKPGTIHKAISRNNLEVLVIMTPAFGEVWDQIYVE
jgi:mannose-6-phosphate isomerase-like protein (cupin superfamily)